MPASHSADPTFADPATGTLKRVVSVRRQAVELLLALGLALTAIHVYFSQDKAYEDFDLGPQTRSIYSTKAEGPIHFENSSPQLEADLRQRCAQHTQPLVWILGNSQTSGVNQALPNADNYLGKLYDRFQNEAWVMGYSIPNANLQEHYLASRYWFAQLPIRTLVIPVFYDDLRENDIRPHFFRYLAAQAKIDEIPGELGAKIRTAVQAFPSGEVPKAEQAEPAGPSATLQDRVETALNQFLDHNLPAWKNRPNVRGEFFIFLYRLRNTVLGIDAQTIRPMLEAHANWNLQALEAIVELAHTRQCQVILYIPPIRQDVDFPYDRAAYDKFKADLRAKYGARSGCTFADLDAIVPGELWGTKASTNLSGKEEYDFMHFQERGHQLLFEQLAKLLEQHPSVAP